MASEVLEVIRRAFYWKRRALFITSLTGCFCMTCAYAMVCGMTRTQTRTADAAQKLRRKLGNEAVITEEGRLEELSGDKWFAHRRPDLGGVSKE